METDANGSDIVLITYALKHLSTEFDWDPQQGNATNNKIS